MLHVGPISHRAHGVVFIVQSFKQTNLANVAVLIFIVFFSSKKSKPNKKHTLQLGKDFHFSVCHFMYLVEELNRKLES